MLVKPRPEILQNRFFLLETQLFPLFIITGILFVNGVFHGKQPIAVLDSLYCRLAVASYVISVRRIKSSLTASFRFYLTIDTLAVQLYTSLSPRRVRDFHPLERAHGAQTTKRMCQGTSLDNLFYILLTESAVPAHSFPELLKFSLRPFHL